MDKQSIKKQMMEWLRWLLPRACPACRQQLGKAAGLCEACQQALRPQLERYSPLDASANPKEHLVTLGRYQGRVMQAVRALKFGGAREVAAVLGERIGGQVPEQWQIVAVIPVPLHPSRLRERGFNQSALLAEVIAREIAAPYVPQALQRMRRTKQQAKLGKHERGTNLKGAFVADLSEVSEGAVLLVDDVCTTGETLKACADALREAGKTEIYYAVAAY